MSNETDVAELVERLRAMRARLDQVEWDFAALLEEVEPALLAGQAAMARLAYYEAPLPLGGAGQYAHRFTEQGICIRCGEDAEEWDAGCVEELLQGCIDAHPEGLPQWVLPPAVNTESNLEL